MGKVCSVCGVEKPIEEYHKNSTNKHGVTNTCKPCATARTRLWYQNNKDRGKENARRGKIKQRSDHATRLYQAAKDRATKFGLEFDISVNDVLIPEVCPVFKTKMIWSTGRSSEDSYSLDRIDPAEGYIKGNIQVISRKANAMKRGANRDDLLLFAKWILQEYGENNDTNTNS